MKGAQPLGAEKRNTAAAGRWGCTALKGAGAEQARQVAVASRQAGTCLGCKQLICLSDTRSTGRCLLQKRAGLVGGGGPCWEAFQRSWTCAGGEVRGGQCSRTGGRPLHGRQAAHTWAAPVCVLHGPRCLTSGAHEPLSQHKEGPCAQHDQVWGNSGLQTILRI